MKIGIAGVGHLGRIHVKCLKEIPEIEIAGIYDINPRRAAEIGHEFGVHLFSSNEEMINHIDALDVVTPTISHFDIAKLALENNKHVFIEKPVTLKTEQAKELNTISEAKNLKVQVGHVERFNPAWNAAQRYIQKPSYIDCYRLSEFLARGTDVPVVLELMIHDLDIVLQTVKSKLIGIKARGQNLVSKEIDFANAVLEFEDGTIANLTASRVSLEKKRTTRFYHKDAIVEVDFLNKNVSIVQKAQLTSYSNGSNRQYTSVYKPEIEQNNAIRDELYYFYKSIISNQKPPVTLEQAYRSLEIAQKIIDIIND